MVIVGVIKDFAKELNFPTLTKTRTETVMLI